MIERIMGLVGINEVILIEDLVSLSLIIEEEEGDIRVIKVTEEEQEDTKVDDTNNRSSNNLSLEMLIVVMVKELPRTVVMDLIILEVDLLPYLRSQESMVINQHQILPIKGVIDLPPTMATLQLLQLMLVIHQDLNFTVPRI